MNRLVDRVSPTLKRKWRDRINHCIGLRNLLNAWELQFVQSMDRRLKDGYNLMPKQVGKLYQIYHRLEERIG